MDEDGDDGNGVDEDDAQASKIWATVWWIPFGGEFPLQIPSGGEVSASCGVSECRISDPSLHGETIWRGGGGATWYGDVVRASPACTDGR